jgi:anti-sigma regulatory factor (Ser/Thr protein kinase)
VSAVTKVAQVNRLDAPRAARAQARSFFVGRVPTTALDDVQLVVSELVTNAMVQGTAPSCCT